MIQGRRSSAEHEDDSLNISVEIKVDTFRVSLEDNTFEKINEILRRELHTNIE